MRNKKKWNALALTVIMIAALALTGCRRDKEPERINVGADSEPTTVVSTEESESESETESESESESETSKTTESNQTSSTEGNSSSTGSSSNNTGSTTTGNTGGSSTGSGSSNGSGSGSSSGTTDNGSGSGSSSDSTGNTTATGDTNASTEGNTSTTGSYADDTARYFYDANGNRIEVTHMPDGTWQDGNGTTYTFGENGVTDSAGNAYYYDPPETGNTTGMEPGTQADFYDDQGNHIICVLDENGNWVDNDGNIYIFGEDGVTDMNGNFYPW